MKTKNFLITLVTLLTLASCSNVIYLKETAKADKSAMKTYLKDLYGFRVQTSIGSSIAQETLMHVRWNCMDVQAARSQSGHDKTLDNEGDKKLCDDIDRIYKYECGTLGLSLAHGQKESEKGWRRRARNKRP